MIKTKLLSSMMLAAGLLSGCSSADSKDEEAAPVSAHSSHAPNGDLQEETSSITAIPPFLVKQKQEIQAVYLQAAKNKKLLESIPCYCGCGDSAGHLNNYDCFVHENKTDGAIVWDDHGTRCGVCLQIAADSIALLNEGKSIKEIRNTVDQKYAKGYSKPTPTPMPEG